MSDDFRDELIQVAAVAIAILTDLEQGSTTLFDPENHRVATPAHNTAMLEVQQERGRQERKWGAQHHTPFEWLAILGEEFGEACMAAVDYQANWES